MLFIHTESWNQMRVLHLQPTQLGQATSHESRAPWGSWLLSLDNAAWESDPDGPRAIVGGALGFLNMGTKSHLGSNAASVPPARSWLRDLGSAFTFGASRSNRPISSTPRWCRSS